MGKEKGGGEDGWESTVSEQANGPGLGDMGGQGETVAKRLGRGDHPSPQRAPRGLAGCRAPHCTSWSCQKQGHHI